MGDAAAQEAAGASPCRQDPPGHGQRGQRCLCRAIFSHRQIGSAATACPADPTKSRRHRAAPVPEPPSHRGPKADPLVAPLPPTGLAKPARARQPACSQDRHPVPQRHHPERGRPAPRSWVRAAGPPKQPCRGAVPGASVPRDPAEGSGPLPTGGSRAEGRWAHAVAPSGTRGASGTRSPPPLGAGG